jgi:hypothetical protein
MRSFGVAFAAVVAGLGFLSSVSAHVAGESNSWLMRPVSNTVMVIGLCILLAVGFGVLVVGRIIALGYRPQDLRRKPRDPNPPTAPIPVPPSTLPEVRRVDPPEASGF